MKKIFENNVYCLMFLLNTTYSISMHLFEHYDHI